MQELDSVAATETDMTETGPNDFFKILLDNIIGQQSAWFWTMIQALAIVISLVLIYRQVRAQRMTNSLATLEKLGERWNSKRLCDARSAIVSVHPSTNKKIDHHEEVVLTFIEEMGGHTKKGVLDVKSVWSLYSYYVEHYWPILSPKVSELRAAAVDDSYYDQAEWLYNKCCKLSQNCGANPRKTDAQLALFAKGELHYVEYRISNL
jgi:hypothetical protein